MAIAGRPLYRRTATALMRSCVVALSDAPDWWPEPDDHESVRAWLQEVWARRDLAAAIAQASPTLAGRIDAICAGRAKPDQIRRAGVAVTSYVLRAVGRPTPFGLFAGIAPLTLGRTGHVRWGGAHRPFARVDTQWLADVVDRLEAYPDLLDRLDVQFTNLAIGRGSRRLEAPRGPDRVSIRRTSVVRAVQEMTGTPTRFSVLVERLAEDFAQERAVAFSLLFELVRQGYLITCLRAPLTIIDPLAYVLDRLGELGAQELPAVTALFRGLAAVKTAVRDLNQDETLTTGWASKRDSVIRRMRGISTAGRTPLAMDVLLDCVVEVPVGVADELARAATALLRLTRQPTGSPVWRDYHAAFCERYGTGVLVPVSEAVNPDTGLGFPAGYPGSLLPAPIDSVSERDERLLALAWQAIVDGSREITLTDDAIEAVTGSVPLDAGAVPPHVELAARILAATPEALQRGEYSLVVAPARAGGTLTSRFTATATGSGLEELYRTLPVTVEGARAVQMSFPPAYPHAENVCRVPAYLPHVLSLGEHRNAEHDAVSLSDLALTATAERLYLISLSHRQVIEPQVLHALALDKQPPPLARFLANLPRAFAAAWTVVDWGPRADRLPFLPQICYGRSILAQARWRLSTSDLPRLPASDQEWRAALMTWRDRWHCPGSVELRDDDRSLRLDLDQPIHALILRTHLARHHDAVLTAAAPDNEYSWLAGHVHEIVVPLVRAGPAAPSPKLSTLPLVDNRCDGQWPGQPDARWLSAHIHTHPERHDEIIAYHLPELVEHLGDCARYWFVRYRGPHQSDHIRLRVGTPDYDHGAQLKVIGEWVQRLRRDGLASRLVLDRYQPENGRYGAGPAMLAAEAAFVADSRVACSQLRHLPAASIHPTALVAANMFQITSAFLGAELASPWLIRRAVGPSPPSSRVVARQAVELVRSAEHPDWADAVVQAWRSRTDALAEYRKVLSHDADVDVVLESLLHMHHNRAVGIDPDHERACRRLARQAAIALQARR